MKVFLMPDAVRTAQMTTQELRAAFLISELFKEGQINISYCDADRAVVGSATPLSEPLALTAGAQLRAKYFTERRELGILNIGGPGTVVVNEKSFEMEPLDCLYVGQGNEEIIFTSGNPDSPAQFYLISYPAHVTHPVTLARKTDAATVNLGTEANCNKRTIYKYIHPAGIKSCQLVMGFTQLDVGSAWNTMPPHTHLRRSEIYLYFNLSADARIFHLMGEPNQTRHLVVSNREVAISPSWSIHAGVGTANYAFCWAMGGENQAFDDMDLLSIGQLT